VIQHPLLICTDLDRTLMPNGPQPESAGARRCFAQLAGRPEVTLVYVTGRHRTLVEEAIAAYRLPPPDFVIGDVGTTIYRVGAEHAWEHLAGWEDEIARDWAGRTHSDLLTLLKAFPVLRLQERSKQNRLKLSYYLPLHQDIDALTPAISERLEQAGIRARLVWSVDDIANVGLLDVLPARASKRHAIEALMREKGFDRDQTVFCGDSGNDLEVLISPIPAVLVANSRNDVMNLARELAAQAGTREQLYVATGGFMGMNGNYGAGMLEGIAHYHPHIAEWLTPPADVHGRPGS
jgi:sucrose-6F-phosphate phosphohydrolase